jgi:hypothetical protein
MLVFPIESATVNETWQWQGTDVREKFKDYLTHKETEVPNKMKI